MTGSNTPRALCLGEGLVVLHPDAAGGRGASPLLECSVGGAEANVAGGLAALGVPSAWVSRLGDDPFGDYIARDLAARDIAVIAPRDGARPTGAYLKEHTPAGSRMHYYRSGSAASVMDGTLLEQPPVSEVLAGCDVVHTSGITAGIIEPDSDLLRRLVAARDRHGFVLSADLNWRPALWQGRSRQPLDELLSAADVVLLGADEAEVALGTADPARLRERLGPRPRLVIKSDAHVATEIEPDGTTTQVPALHVDVIEPIGAGDGFAAGYLAGLIGGLDATGRLRLGHLTAASVLVEPGDHVRRAPDARMRRRLVTATAEEWSAFRVSAAVIGSTQEEGSVTSR